MTEYKYHYKQSSHSKMYPYPFIENIEPRKNRFIVQKIYCFIGILYIVFWLRWLTYSPQIHRIQDRRMQHTVNYNEVELNKANREYDSVTAVQDRFTPKF